MENERRVDDDNDSATRALDVMKKARNDICDFLDRATGVGKLIDELRGYSQQNSFSDEDMSCIIRSSIIMQFKRCMRANFGEDATILHLLKFSKGYFDFCHTDPYKFNLLSKLEIWFYNAKYFKAFRRFLDFWIKNDYVPQHVVESFLKVFRGCPEIREREYLEALLSTTPGSYGKKDVAAATPSRQINLPCLTSTAGGKRQSGLQGTRRVSEAVGVAPVTDTIVKEKQRREKRMKAGKTKGKECDGGRENLDPGQSRAKVVNEAGPETFEPVAAKPKKFAPKIDKENLRNLTVKCGEPFFFNVKFSGEPPPNINWALNKKIIHMDGRRRLINDSNNTKFYNDNATRMDTGTYSISARNECGRDVAEVEVLVLSKPEKPKGRLQVTDITKEKCNLKWTKPRDDGGAPIVHYLVEGLDPDTGDWTPVGMTKDLDTDVTELESGREYSFRVKAVNKEGESLPLETLSAIVAKDPFSVADKPGTPVIVDWSANHVELEWEPPISDGGTPIEGYIIEKRNNYNSLWDKSGETVGPESKIIAGELTEGQEYQFRVVPVNKAGNGEPSDPTNPLIAKGRYLVSKIDQKNLRENTLSAESALEFDGDIIGTESAIVDENPFDEQGVPGNLQGIDRDKDHVGQDFATQQDDGGSSISGSIVEQNDNFGGWEEALDVPADVTIAPAPDLTEGFIDILPQVQSLSLGPGTSKKRETRVCPVCSKSYKNLGSYTKHFRTHESPENIRAEAITRSIMSPNKASSSTSVNVQEVDVTATHQKNTIAFPGQPASLAKNKNKRRHPETCGLPTPLVKQPKRTLDNEEANVVGSIVNLDDIQPEEPLTTTPQGPVIELVEKTSIFSGEHLPPLPAVQHVTNKEGVCPTVSNDGVARSSQMYDGLINDAGFTDFCELMFLRPSLLGRLYSLGLMDLSAIMHNYKRKGSGLSERGEFGFEQRSQDLIVERYDAAYIRGWEFDFDHPEPEMKSRILWQESVVPEGFADDCDDLWRDVISNCNDGRMRFYLKKKTEKSPARIFFEPVYTRKNSWDGYAIPMDLKHLECHYMCLYCTRIFASRESGRKHSVRSHPSGNRLECYSCPKCQRTFTRQETVERHVENSSCGSLNTGRKRMAHPEYGLGIDGLKEFMKSNLLLIHKMFYKLYKKDPYTEHAAAIKLLMQANKQSAQPEGSSGSKQPSPTESNRSLDSTGW